ncbi:MAG: transposase, partial [Dehalococcoidia bacterium]|nr:transposase [Dehalococcoidia bacterium]
MVTLLLPFEHLFGRRTWRKAQLLVMGAILSPGKRTVSSALSILGIGQRGDFAIYHQALNRARWSPLQLSRVLLLVVAGRLGSSTEPLLGFTQFKRRKLGNPPFGGTSRRGVPE